MKFNRRGFIGSLVGLFVVKQEEQPKKVVEELSYPFYRTTEILTVKGGPDVHLVTTYRNKL